MSAKELDETLDALGLNKEIFYNHSTKNQQTLLDLYALQHEHQLMLQERTKTGWTIPDLKQGLQIVRKLSRQASEHLKQHPRSRIKADLEELKEYAIEAIHDLEDTQKEAIARAANEPPPQTFGDVIGEIFEGTSKVFLWGSIIFLILAVIGSFLLFLFGPTHIFPIFKECHSGEEILDCYWRVQAEKNYVDKFEECQRACGRGLGNEICLEQCEYTYQMGKWKYARTYTTSTGKSFICPQGQEGYEDTQGKGYCQ